VLVAVGPIFGNAVRDGTGLFNVNDYPNSQAFNRLSTELNALVETRVLPTLREKASIGSTVQFTGVAEVEEDAEQVVPLRVVPVAAEVK
jgi:predicted lipoprotein